MNYNKEIKKARLTCEGINLKFQEKENHKEAIDGFDCPYCKATLGCKMNGSKIIYNSPKEIIDKYETSIDIKNMCEVTCYSWTEDCKCSNCGEMYSQHNGC